MWLVPYVNITTIKASIFSYFYFHEGISPSFFLLYPTNTNWWYCQLSVSSLVNSVCTRISGACRTKMSGMADLPTNLPHSADFPKIIRTKTNYQLNSLFFFWLSLLPRLCLSKSLQAGLFGRKSTFWIQRYLFSQDCHWLLESNPSLLSLVSWLSSVNQ